MSPFLQKLMWVLGVLAAVGPLSLVKPLQFYALAGLSFCALVPGGLLATALGVRGMYKNRNEGSETAYTRWYLLRALAGLGLSALGGVGLFVTMLLGAHS